MNMMLPLLLRWWQRLPDDGREMSKKLASASQCIPLFSKEGNDYPVATITMFPLPLTYPSRPAGPRLLELLLKKKCNCFSVPVIVNSSIKFQRCHYKSPFTIKYNQAQK